MDDIIWSGSEKKVARRAFDKALERALAKIMAEFKARASAVTTPEEMWAIGEDLYRRRREVEDMFDNRYSQLLLVFPQLIREGYLDQEELSGLADEKMERIRYFLSGRK